MKAAFLAVLILALSTLAMADDREQRRIFAGVAYAPSHARTDTPESYATEERIRGDLKLLSMVTGRVRTYSIENGMDRVPAIAAALGMKVSLGIWLGPDKVANDRQIRSAIQLLRADHGTIDRVFVGNETLLRGDLNLAELRAYLRRVKEGLDGKAIQVTTGETWGYWLKYPDLALDCDVIGAHILPYWDGYPLEAAVRDVTEQHAALQAAFPGKSIVVAETGWPSRGQPRQGAVPFAGGQELFLSALLNDPRTQGLDYYIVEAFDQPWKIPVEGEVGAAWGLFSTDAKTKVDFSKLRATGFGPAHASAADMVQNEIRAQVTTEINPALLRIYKASGFSPIWQGSRQADHRKKSLVQALGQREAHGLPPDRACTAPTPDARSASSVAAADVGLTHCLMRLYQDISIGMARKPDLGKDWHIAPMSAELTDSDIADILAGNIGPVLSRKVPQSSQYADLQRFLAAYHAMQKGGGWQSIPGTDEVLPDGADARLALVIARLRAEDYLPSGQDTSTQQLDDAVRRFQARNGLDADGRMGKRTLAAMNVPISQRVAQIAVNMERWRHVPAFEPSHVEVNVADASLVIHQTGNIPARLRTVVGAPKHPTPVFRTDLTGVTFNPSWTIPASIASREILPKLKRNPKYLIENEIAILNNERDPHGLSIDWRSFSQTRFPFQLRQKPGSKNPLGLLKFEMANPFDVYIHDTPVKSFFTLPRRGLSHGCIRVENPESLATRLLPNLTEQDIRDVIGSGVTQTLPLPRPLPVYVLYGTAFVDSAGQLNFREDIYGRDVAIAKVLRLHGASPPPDDSQLIPKDNCAPTA